jgi:hypothetical protein
MMAAGFACIREPRHRLMRRALASIGGETVELKLRNISSMGALAECKVAVAPDTELTIDIVGAGPVRGIVRWAQSGQFGLQFEGQFDLAQLAPKRETPSHVAMMRPRYLEHGSKSEARYKPAKRRPSTRSFP